MHDDNPIIREWEKARGHCEHRIEFVAYMRSYYGDNVKQLGKDFAEGLKIAEEKCLNEKKGDIDHA